MQNRLVFPPQVSGSPMPRIPARYNCALGASRRRARLPTPFVYGTGSHCFEFVSYLQYIWPAQIGHLEGVVCSAWSSIARYLPEWVLLTNSSSWALVMIPSYDLAPEEYFKPTQYSSHNNDLPFTSGYMEWKDTVT